MAGLVLSSIPPLVERTFSHVLPPSNQRTFAETSVTNEGRCVTACIRLPITFLGSLAETSSLYVRHGLHAFPTRIFRHNMDNAHESVRRSAPVYPTPKSGRNDRGSRTHRHRTAGSTDVAKRASMPATVPAIPSFRRSATQHTMSVKRRRPHTSSDDGDNLFKAHRAPSALHQRLHSIDTPHLSLSSTSPFQLHRSQRYASWDSTSRTTSSSFATVSSDDEEDFTYFQEEEMEGETLAGRQAMHCRDSIDTSSNSSEISAPSLPRSPYPVDPYHFYCLSQLSTPSVVRSLSKVLIESDVQFKLRPQKCKFKCIQNVQYSQLEFVIRVYATGRGPLVEFQRRRGNVLVWDALYHLLYRQLLSTCVDLNAPACPQSGGRQKKVAVGSSILSNGSKSFSVDDAYQHWRDAFDANAAPTSGLDAMKIMLTSKYRDAQREGCAGVAALTVDTASALLVVQHGLMTSLVGSADQEDDLEMAQCAVAALANVAEAVPSFKDEEMVQKAKIHLKRAIKVVVHAIETTQDSMYSVHLLRDCTRALGSFAKVCPTASLQGVALSRLRQLSYHQDVTLAGHSRRALRLVDPYL